jgi:uncharacterized repeat protein (TIGR03803 family)
VRISDVGCVALSLCVTALLADCSGVQPLVGSPGAFPPHPASASRGLVDQSVPSGEQVLYSFTGGNDGGDAATALVFDRVGNLYGTTVVGGTSSCGTIFKLTPQPTPQWRETVLYNFGCYADGKNPYGGATFDSRATIYGTTVSGGSGGSCGSSGCGVVFEFSGEAETVLHNFTGGEDGSGPGGGVAIDRAGRLFGTTPDGGAYSEGVVYEVSRSAGHWRERVIHSFTGGSDGGVGSLGLLLIDSSDSLNGLTELGGAHGDGTVFKLSPISKSAWRLSTLYAFKGMPDGASPYGGLVADGAGNLYGTTYYGGSENLGSIFELEAKRGYRERVLYSFKGGSDGAYSTSTLVFGKSANLYGTTSMGGGTCDCGTIFKLSPTSRKETVLHGFGAGPDGAYPYYGLTKDRSGNFYGTTVAGGRFNQGTVFRFAP